MRKSDIRRLEFEAEWGDLSRYNSEVARGIVHTDEWKAKMAEKQERYNRVQHTLRPDVITRPPGRERMND